MKLVLLLFALTSLKSYAGQAKCENALEGDRSMATLAQVIIRDSMDQAVAYTIRMRAKRITANGLREILKLQPRISRYGDTVFSLQEVTASSSNLVLDFTLSGNGRNVVQSVMELSSPKIEEHYGLEVVSWTKASENPNQPDAPLLQGEELAQAARLKLETIEFSLRTTNALKKENIVYIGDLVHYNNSRLLRIENFGRRSLNEVKAKLKHMSLSLEMKIPGWPYDDLN